MNSQTKRIQITKTLIKIITEKGEDIWELY